MALYEPRSPCPFIISLSVDNANASSVLKFPDKYKQIHGVLGLLRMDVLLVITGSVSY